MGKASRQKRERRETGEQFAKPEKIPTRPYETEEQWQIRRARAAAQRRRAEARNRRISAMVERGLSRQRAE